MFKQQQWERAIKDILIKIYFYIAVKQVTAWNNTQPHAAFWQQMNISFSTDISYNKTNAKNWVIAFVFICNPFIPY